MSSPPTKRIKLESSPSPTRVLDHNNVPSRESEDQEDLEESDVEHCSICLQPYADRTMIPTCSHEFCFECLIIWTDQSRRCPLCSQDVGKYLMHNIRSKYDYQKHYLAPLRTSPPPHAVATVRADARRRAERRRAVEWGRRRQREMEEADELERAIEKRRWVYRYNLYAKHVASNPYTRYRPFPTPAQFAASPDYVSRATVFIRRELRVWVGLDIEFLTTFTISLMKSLDIRSEPAVRLLSEFLDMDAERGHERANAEHFAHELYCYLRSPYRDLSAYDSSVQYDVPPNIPPPDAPEQRRARWRSRSRSSSRSHSPSRDVPSRLSPSSPRRRPPTSRSASRSSSSYLNHTVASPHSPGSIEAEQRPGRSRDPPRNERHPRGRGRRSHSRYDDRTSSPPLSDRQIRRRSRTPRHRVLDRQNGRYDAKGKNRADDVGVNDSPCFSSHKDTMAVDGSVRAATHGTTRGSWDSPASGQNSHDTSALSSPPLTADLPAASAQSEPTNLAALGLGFDIVCDDQGQSAAHVLSDIGSGTSCSRSLHAPKQEKPPVRVRRSAWQAMREHLASGGKQESVLRNAASGPGHISSSKSQVPGNSVSITTNEALSPGDPSPSKDTVPSLLLRLSDPVATASVAPQNTDTNASDRGPGSRRETLTVPKGGRGISVPEMTVRTRARLARTAAGADPSPASHLTPSVQHTGAAGRQHAAEGTSDVGTAAEAVEHMSSEAHPGARATAHDARSAQPSPSLADARFLLMQKLELEKLRALVVPTAEKEVLLSLPAAARTHPGPLSVPMTLSDGTREELTKSAPVADIVVAERQAERREAELRSQAQLRLRLAAAKRAANTVHSASSGIGTGSSIGRTGDRTGGSSVIVNESLTSQEVLLKSKLKARKV